MRLLSTVLPFALVLIAVSARAELRDKHSWKHQQWTYAFSETYPATYRIFNAFDFGHAILYQNLYLSGGQNVTFLEQDTFNDLIERLITATTPDDESSWTSIFRTNPYRFPLDEEAIAPDYAKIAWKAMNMFDWVHALHGRIYDILSFSGLTDAQRRAAVDEELHTYFGVAHLDFTRECKDMDLLMDGQYYSKSFRQLYPKFNALIWAYHWLQMNVYDRILTRDLAKRDAGMRAAMIRFARTVGDITFPGNQPELEQNRIATAKRFSFAKNLPDGELGPDKSIPLSMMPMTHMSAPEFNKTYPELAAIFDNLHMMHDVISDILVSTQVAGRDAKHREIYAAIDNFQDPKKFIVPCMGSEPATPPTPGEPGGGRRPGIR